MHGTQARLRVLDFKTVALRLTEADLYRRILGVVGQKIEKEELINQAIIAQATGIHPNQVGVILRKHEPLVRILHRYQRVRGRTRCRRCYGVHKRAL